MTPPRMVSAFASVVLCALLAAAIVATQSEGAPRQSSGSTGSTGPSGTTGPTSPSGPSGPTGPTGPFVGDGVICFPSPTGPSGPTSTADPTSPTGETTGPTGPTEPTGPTGPTGTTGPRPTGPTGPRPTGPTGPPGFVCFPYEPEKPEVGRLRFKLVPVAGQRARRAARFGLLLRARCNRHCRVTVRVGVGRVWDGQTRRVLRRGRGVVRVRFGRAQRRTLRQERSVRVLGRARDRGGRRSPYVFRRISLRR